MPTAATSTDPDRAPTPPTAHARYSDIVRIHGGLIWRVCESYEHDPDLAKDLFQDCLFALWKALDTYRGEASLKTFTARIAHNRGISHAVRAASQPRTFPLEPDRRDNSASPEDQMHTALKRSKVLAAVTSLPLDWRPIITMTLEDFTPHEIAEVLGISANSVSIRLTRAKKRLSEILGVSA